MTRVLPTETAMAIQERILAGASLRQIMGEFGVGKGTVSRYRAIAIKTSALRRDRPHADFGNSPFNCRARGQEHSAIAERRRRTERKSQLRGDAGPASAAAVATLA